MGLIGNSPFEKDGGRRFWNKKGETEDWNIFPSLCDSGDERDDTLSAHIMSPLFLSSPFGSDGFQAS